MLAQAFELSSTAKPELKETVIADAVFLPNFNCNSPEGGEIR
jgi:hypothetical protein